MMDHDTVFLELYEGHFDRIFFHFRRKGIRKEDALDLAQDTFARVYRGMASYRREAAGAYVLQVAENVWKNHLRYWATESRAGNEVPVDDHALSVPDASNVVRDLELHERKERLEDALMELPLRMQRCFRFWFDGLKYREIAAVMNISLDTVKSLIYQGKKRLHERLGDTDFSADSADRKGDPDG